jgi:hypothetical protein
MADLELLKRPYLSALEALGWGVVTSTDDHLVVDLGAGSGHLSLDGADPGYLRFWVTTDLRNADLRAARLAAEFTTSKIKCVKVRVEERVEEGLVVFAVESLVADPGLVPTVHELVGRLPRMHRMLHDAVVHYWQDAVVLAGIQVASEAA